MIRLDARVLEVRIRRFDCTYEVYYRIDHLNYNPLFLLIIIPKYHFLCAKNNLTKLKNKEKKFDSQPLSKNGL